MAEQSQDQKITSAVREALQLDSRVDEKKISIRVDKAVVTLTGTVGRYLDRIAAAEDAWGVKGVKEVRNRLQVQPDTIRPADEIAADVAAALESDPRADERSIVVNVSEGIVRLSGAVSNAAERAAAEECAWQAQGVVEVSNELTLSPDRRRPDAEIEQDVRAALNIDARVSDPTLIAVRSVAGTVRLQGTVSSVEERRAAEKDAWYTAGVVYVENLLTITGGRQQPAAA